MDYSETKEHLDEVAKFLFLNVRYNKSICGRFRFCLPKAAQVIAKYKFQWK